MILAIGLVMVSVYLNTRNNNPTVSEIIEAQGKGYTVQELKTTSVPGTYESLYDVVPRGGVPYSLETLDQKVTWGNLNED